MQPRADGVSRIVLESVQELLLKLALQMAAGKYAGRAPDRATHQRIVTLRAAGQTIQRTAELTGSSVSQVKRIWALHLSKS